jgi:hypothetical protein
MANTYIALATTTVGSGGASTIEFSNIPQTYTDLHLLISIRQSVAGEFNSGSYVRFNNNSSTSYSRKSLYGDGTSPGTGNYSSLTYGWWSWNGNPTAGNTANTFTNAEIYIPNYTGSTAKSFMTNQVSENNTTLAIIETNASLWNNTSAITSITIGPESGNFVQYSTATLYGIKKD